VRRRLLLAREDGQAIVEFALVLPLLMALLLGIVQFGILWNNYETITDAARIGARKAAVARFYGDNGASAIAAAKAAATNLDLSAPNAVTVTSCPPSTPSCTTNDWSTPGNVVTVTVTYPYSLKILDWTVKAGNLTTVSKERLE
jgi:Flp pilus assembly protein TadG